MGSENKSEETPEQRRARVVALFNRRLTFTLNSFGAVRAHLPHVLDFNDSIEAARRALNPRARAKRPRRRLHPEVELLVNVKALEIARATDPNVDRFGPADVRAAAAELVAMFKPRCGRRADFILTHTVHALMTLHQQTCGRPLTANSTRNGSYEPHISSPLGQLILKQLQRIDPSVTLTRFVGIVVAARASGTVHGKRFDDLMPAFGCHVDGSTGALVAGTGYQVERFVPIMPIYSS